MKNKENNLFEAIQSLKKILFANKVIILKIV